MQSRGHAIWIVCIVFPIITGLFMSLRLYCRIWITKAMYASDWIALATMAPIIAFSVTEAQATYHGMGQHEADFTAAQSSDYYYWIQVSSEFYVLSLIGFKTSIILLYIQIFGVNRKFRYCCYAVLFYVLGFGISNLITEVAGCSPIRKFWNPDVPGHCIDYVASDIAYGFGYISSDLMIAILPVPMVWKLSLPTLREKIGLALVLTSGGICFIISTARWIVSTIDLVSTDRTWIAGAAFLLAIVEVNTGLICSCTPAMKPLFIIARRASIDLSARYASRRASAETTESARNEIRMSLDKPLPSLPEMATSISTRSNSGSDNAKLAEMDSRTVHAEMPNDHQRPAEMPQEGRARHELMAEELARHELDVAEMGLAKHDAYDGQNEITEPSKKG